MAVAPMMGISTGAAKMSKVASGSRSIAHVRAKSTSCANNNLVHINRQRHYRSFNRSCGSMSERMILCAAQALPKVEQSSANGSTSSIITQSSPEQDSIPDDGYAGGWGSDEWGRGTDAVHGGEHKFRPRVRDSLTTPIVQTATYTFKNTEELIAYQEERYTSFEYGRYGNPTSMAVEEKIRKMEGAEDCLLQSSGMCSATTMLLSIVPAGGHIITTTDCYRRTRQFIQTFLPKLGITTTVIDPADYEGLEKALEENENTALFFSESPTNPYLRCIDIERVKKLCGPRNCVVCIDGTFATACNSRVLDFGADLVIHSATKFLAGHNDVLAGVIAGRRDLIQTVRKFHHILGGVIDPQASYLLLRGMKTLDIRVARQNETALKLATELEAHPKIERVHYPGLPSHPEHEIAKKQMKGFGGVISFEIVGGLEETSLFIDSCNLPYIAPSLGGVESLIEQPSVVSYWDQGVEGRKKIGIKDNLVRFSCGIENYEDIRNDMFQALDKI